LKPLPFDEPDRLVGVWHAAPALKFDQIEMSPSNYFIYREQGTTFQDVGMYTSDSVSITGLAKPEKVKAADVLVVGTPIWLGEKSSVCQKLIERLYGMSSQLNDRGQYSYYGKVGGCIVTGNEDGIKHVAMGVLYSLQHIGYTIPPQADAGWIGEAGPGPSYGDMGEDGKRIGFDNQFTQRNTTFAAWNMLHLARLLKDSGGIPAHGNQRSLWEAGCRFGYENPEYR
ncbi:hypothetical protein EHM82_02310, partial [bacterium]